MRNERSITHMSYKLTCGPRGRESVMAQTFRSDQEQDLSKVAWRHPEAQRLRNYRSALFSEPWARGNNRGDRSCSNCCSGFFQRNCNFFIR